MRAKMLKREAAPRSVCLLLELAFAFVLAAALVMWPLPSIAQTKSSKSATTLNPSISVGDRAQVDVPCVCLREDGNLVALSQGNELLDTAIRISTPFIARSTLGAACNSVCTANGGRCVGGLSVISWYDPQFKSTNSRAPGYTYLRVSVPEVSRRNCD